MCPRVVLWPWAGGCRRGLEDTVLPGPCSARNCPGAFQGRPQQCSGTVWVGLGIEPPGLAGCRNVWSWDQSITLRTTVTMLFQIQSQNGNLSTTSYLPVWARIKRETAIVDSISRDRSQRTDKQLSWDTCDTEGKPPPCQHRQNLPQQPLPLGPGCRLTQAHPVLCSVPVPGTGQSTLRLGQHSSRIIRQEGQQSQLNCSIIQDL